MTADPRAEPMVHGKAALKPEATAAQPRLPQDRAESAGTRRVSGLLGSTGRDLADTMF
ncbi:hypothetical protein MSM1_10725 [Mycobacterium sp. SM1]|uniref:hypothetical protein n=1 Tax=Mycobacterium sp. SM1 TaxID=2816243 RepID=UPI001BD0A47A|nr:hypothetical protein [Mycobacterium sp. SM1]MBS4728784.1 hypothetical protein [Mycobacterium sp. SM1]